MVIYLYPGYQRFCRVCDGELRFVGSRLTHVRPKAEDTRKPETETGNRLLDGSLMAGGGCGLFWLVCLFFLRQVQESDTTQSAL